MVLKAISFGLAATVLTTALAIPVYAKSANAIGAVRTQKPLTVLAVGGSSAQGYDDPKLDGYLSRALTTVSKELKRPISFVNKAKSGNIPAKVASQYEPLLQSVQPDVVIISWGLLNDISKKTPPDTFRSSIQAEVSMAIQHGADVWIVTPPATPATYVGHDVELEPQYANMEISAARAVQSAHVHVLDLLNDMKYYLKERHLSYKSYAQNNWHLNQAGHVLAGQILAKSILSRTKLLGLTN